MKEHREMPKQLAITVETLLGLAFDVEKADEKPGFRPAPRDMGGDAALFGELRLSGFADALRLGFAQRMIVLGGDERRYLPIEKINRAQMIAIMLQTKFRISPWRLDWKETQSNTGGNIAAIRELEAAGLDLSKCAVCSNLYHLPRAAMDMNAAGLSHVPLFPAEAFAVGKTLRDNSPPVTEGDVVGALAANLGGGPLAYRYAMECCGAWHKIAGAYRAKTA